LVRSITAKYCCRRSPGTSLYTSLPSSGRPVPGSVRNSQVLTGSVRTSWKTTVNVTVNTLLTVVTLLDNFRAASDRKYGWNRSRGGDAGGGGGAKVGLVLYRSSHSRGSW